MQAARIPKRVPIGTKYVIEGKRRSEGQVHIFSRYLVFPDGRCFDLPSDVPPLAIPRQRSASRRTRKG
jgi:predicted component of type VI protein secretion system